LREKPSLLRRVVAVADVLDIAFYLWLVHTRAAFAALISDREVWLIGDRSIDDVLIKHRRQGTLSKRVAELIRGLVPRFEVTVWLQVEPQVGMRRDGDFDLPYYEELYAAYSAAAEQYGWRVVSERGRTPEEVHASVVERLGLISTNPHGYQGRLREIPV
jgi:thymidylate kinase